MADPSYISIEPVQYNHLNNIDDISGRCFSTFSVGINDINYNLYGDSIRAGVRDTLERYHKKLTDYLDKRVMVGEKLVYDKIKMAEHQQTYTDELIRQMDLFPEQLFIFRDRNYRVWNEKTRKYEQLDIPNPPQASITYYGCMEQKLVFGRKIVEDIPIFTILSYYTHIYSYKRNNRRTTEWVAKWKHLDERHLDHLIEEKVICHDKIYYF